MTTVCIDKTIIFKKPFLILFWILFGLNIITAVVNLVLHKSDLCPEKPPTRQWFQKIPKICPLIEPMGSGLWTFPFICSLLVLLGIKTKFIRAIIACSWFSLLISILALIFELMLLVRYQIRITIFNNHFEEQNQ